MGLATITILIVLLLIFTLSRNRANERRHSEMSTERARRLRNAESAGVSTAVDDY